MALACKVDDCGRSGKLRRGLCNMHWKRWRTHGDVHKVLKGGGCRGLGADNPNGKDAPTYEAAHQRVRQLHGRAADHSCVRCEGTAAHWAYLHSDPQELIDPRGRAYSTDPARYVAMCVPCHKAFDLAQLAPVVAESCYDDGTGAPIVKVGP